MGAVPARLCDVCSKPGACCKDFRLSNTFWADEGDEGVAARLAKWDTDRAPDLHPFIPGDVTDVFQDENGRSYVQRRFSCTALTASGRCSIYDRRPQPCRLYEPASDDLCVMYKG